MQLSVDTQHHDLLQRITQLEAELAVVKNREAEMQAQIMAMETHMALRRSVQTAESSARLNTILSVCAAMLATRDVDTILHLVVREARTLLAGTSDALLYLADAEGHQLMLKAVGSGTPANLIIQPEQGVTGRAFLAPRALLIVGPELEMALEELTPRQLEEMKKILHPWPPTSALAAPLRVESHRLGALVLYGGTSSHLYHPRDLPFVQALADLIAVAIEESRQRARAAALQHDLARTRSMHAEAQARLDVVQAQLLQSAKLAAVGELAASVAHEINNPLYAARNSLYLVAQDLPADMPQRPLLDIAQGELGRIARIITRMRDFYRPTRAELAPTDINDLLLETIELVQTHLRHSDVVTSSDLAGNLPPITAQADQLRQVFLNLMLNACDAMPTGGRLSVETQYIPPKDDQPGEIVIRIGDTGVGIAPEHHSHLFEPFYTTKPQGTGLGLAISAHIVTQHAGQIMFESEIGKGTTFTISLPLRV